MTKALNGLRVIDVTRLLTGPYCSMVLADLGADVVKIEVPERGDDSRLFGPFASGESGYFMTLNRNKRGITLDLRKAEGKEVFKDLIKTADVLLENFAVGTMDGWELGYEVLAQINPRLIFASITGFGQFGPYAHRVAFDAIAQAMGGMMSINGYPDGPPTRLGSSLGDINAANIMATGILAALYQREKSGLGQHIDVSMHDGIVAILENAIVRYTIDKIVPQRIGSRHATVTPYDVYAASDGYVMIACANEATWQRLCKAMHQEELIADERFEINKQRTANAVVLSEIISEWVGRYTVKEVGDILEQNAVPSGPVLAIDEVVNDEHIRARNMMAEIDHPVAGKVIIPGNPIKMSAASDSIDRPSPTLGQHTDEVLTEIGYSPGKIAGLRAAKII